MRIAVHFYSYFKELTGCEQTSVELPPNTSLRDLYQQLISQFPELAVMEKSTLMAVGVDYQTRDYLLKSGDEVSLFPPVQGG
jgi:molybdopterin converting factor small subunit